MTDDAKLAILIDADNISPKYMELIMKETAVYGIATVRRIYCDWTDVSKASWKKVLLDNSFTPIQQYSYTTGKNSSDSAMIIDAMDLLYGGAVDGFVLVTSDSDFTRLASRLRESGKRVIGMGESKTPSAFVRACEQFKALDVLMEAARKEASEEKIREDKTTAAKEKRTRYTSSSSSPAPTHAPVPAPAPADTEGESEKGDEKENTITSLRNIKKLVKSILLDHSDEEWMFLGTIGNMIIKSYPDFDPRNYGFRKVKDLFNAMPEFEVRTRRAANGATLVYIKSRQQ